MSWWPGNASTPTPSPAPEPPKAESAQDVAESSRPATRNATSTSESPHSFLSIPYTSERIRDIYAPARDRIRRSSINRSPSPRPSESEAFSFPPNINSMDEATIQRLMEAAIRATQSTSTQQVQSLRKPGIPAFDKRNVEIWIKRVEAAYARVHCVNPALKFAHLEAKFEVNADPIVDGFLFGEATEENWTSFLAYLRQRHGPTKKEQALTVINGIPREGRTPSQLAAVMKDRAGKITLDDIMKEQLLKQLPLEILKHLVDRIEGLSCNETAKLADAWFDKDGNALIPTSPTSVNNVSHPTPSSTASAAAAAPEADYTPALRYRQGLKQQFNINNRGGSRGRGRGGNNGNRGNSNTNSYGESSSYSTPDGAAKKQVCNFHIKFGDKAENCKKWCILYPTSKAAKGKPAA